MTRRSGDLPKKKNERVLSQAQIMLKPHNLQLLANRRRQGRDAPELTPELQPRIEENEDDETPNLDDHSDTVYPNKTDVVHEIMKSIRNNERQNKVFRTLRISMNDCEIRNSRLYYRDRLFVPENKDSRFEIIKQAHISVSEKHGGRGKTFVLITRAYSFRKCSGIW